MTDDDALEGRGHISKFLYDVICRPPKQTWREENIFWENCKSRKNRGNILTLPPNCKFSHKIISKIFRLDTLSCDFLKKPQQHGTYVLHYLREGHKNFILYSLLHSKKTVTSINLKKKTVKNLCIVYAKFLKLIEEPTIQAVHLTHLLVFVVRLWNDWKHQICQNSNYFNCNLEEAKKEKRTRARNSTL